jgi:hypothetical protein
LPVASVFVVVFLVVFLVWAPVVPFERLVSIEAPASSTPCAGAQVCSTRPFDVWVKSYGSFTYDAFGFGTAPFVGPVSVEKNGAVTLIVFEGTNETASVAFPASSPEPLALLRVNGVTVYPKGAPFGGSVMQVSVTNLGVGETASVNWWIGAVTSFGFQSSTTSIPAGGTARINATSWTQQPPPQNSNVTITLRATLYYPKLWLHAFVIETAQVAYSS